MPSTYASPRAVSLVVFTDMAIVRRGFTMPMNQVVYVRHLYVFLLFFISSLFFYRIAKRITKNEVQAIVGTAIYILCPRILAHSFFNIKDSVFLSVFVINLFSAICFIEGAKWKAVIGLAITTALCVNTRIVGAVVIVLTLVLAIAKALYYRENIRGTIIKSSLTAELEEKMRGMAELLKYALIVVSTAPILCAYPFAQKYFTKGVMVGSLKG